MVAQLLFGLIFVSLVGVELCLHLCLCCSSIPIKLLVRGAERLALSDVYSFWVPIVMFLRNETFFMC